jgi:hypothetical protein
MREEESDPDLKFETRALVPTLEGRSDGSQHRPRQRFVPSSKGSRGLVGTSKRSPRLADDDGFTREEQSEADFAGGHAASRIDVRPASKRPGRGTYGSESISSNHKIKFLRPTTVFPRGKRPLKTAADLLTDAKKYRAITTFKDKSRSYFKRSPQAPYRAKLNPKLTTSRGWKRQLNNYDLRNTMLRPGRSRSDLRHTDVAAITSRSMFPNLAR